MKKKSNLAAGYCWNRSTSFLCYNSKDVWGWVYTCLVNWNHSVCRLSIYKHSCRSYSRLFTSFNDWMSFLVST